MNPNTTEVALSAAEVAAITGLTTYEVQKLHSEEFGVPGHWSLNRQGVVVYTDRGITGLVQALTDAGKIGASAKLYSRLIELRQKHDTPSRALIAPGAKSSEPYYRRHSTLE